MNNPNFSTILFSVSMISISCATEKNQTDTSMETIDDTGTEIPEETIESIPPSVLSISPDSNENAVSIGEDITVSFSEAMDIASISTNTSDSSCSGTLQLSLDDFSTCVMMSEAPLSSNSDSVFTIVPADGMAHGTTYKMRVTTAALDVVGNPMDVQFEPSDGFTTWGGTTQEGTSEDDWGTGIAVDSSGNIYVAGTTKGDFDDNTSFGGCDIILIKYDVNGLKQWTKQLGTSEDDWGTSVAVDSQDNIYVTGSTKGDFDGNTGFGDKDIVLIKFDASGTKEWTKQMGTHSTESGNIVRADSQDNIYVAGETTGELDGNEHAWREDIFLMKFDSSGTKEWTQQLGGEDSDWVYDIAFSIGSLGDWVVVTGYTLGEIDGHTSQGDDDIFIVLYDSNGLKQNSKQIGTEYSDKARGVAIDSNDNIYITGETRGQFEGNSNQSNGYRNDIFLLKYNLDFEPIWHQQLGVAEHDWGTSIVVDQSDNLFVTGATTGGLDENESAGGNDISLMKYNSDGVKQWVKQTGSSANDIGERLVLDADGNIYITGHTYGSLYGYTNTGGIDLFMMKYNVLGEPE